ncbi:hypothetical protein DB42_BS00290 [Neochlamydia sp. EPS4]|uniref:hypothetical protein n=1 Tax=Neochlamydia sp. EPS4 TaxID=1478175 RepID=UPI000582E494|nr:hypothetical protein [Neochlamydia sp. EPS4]KIC73714.1 hypothetical protein DB42_BS00290 [Neochlamydia sp. EPS4]
MEPSRERYITFLFSLLEESQIHDNPALKKMLENQLDELMSQESEELTEKEKINYKWTKNLLGENKKVRQFALEKLQQIHSPSSPLPAVVPQPSTSFASSSSISSTREIHALSPPSVTSVPAPLQPPEPLETIRRGSAIDEHHRIGPHAKNLVMGIKGGKARVNQMDQESHSQSAVVANPSDKTAQVLAEGMFGSRPK